MALKITIGIAMLVVNFVITGVIINMPKGSKYKSDEAFLLAFVPLTLGSICGFIILNC